MANPSEKQQRAFSEHDSGLEVAPHDYSSQPGLEAVSGPYVPGSHLQSPTPIQSPSVVSDPLMGNPQQTGYYGQTPHQNYDYSHVNTQDPPPPFPVKNEFNNGNNNYNQGAAGVGGGAVGAGTGHNNTSRQDRRICGLKRWLFILLVVLAIVVVAAAVGGGVGGSLAGKHSTNSSAAAVNGTSSTGNATSPTSTPTVGNSTSNSTSTTSSIATSFPTSVAAVQFNDAHTIGVFYQDAATGDLYISGFYGKSGQNSEWHDPIKITGLDPAPRPNSTFAAVYNLTDQNSISIYYAATNNTMFDASGIVSLPAFTMGTLAADTQYSVLVADNGGIAANPWIVTDELGDFYSTRVYYLDRATNQPKELAKDSGTAWEITAQQFEKAGPGSQISTAWLPADNFTSTDNQVQHLFYMDARNNLRHFPGYNGVWTSSNIETVASLKAGQPFASTVWDDVDKNNTLRLFWLSSSTGRFTTIDCMGANPDVTPGFDGQGTCGGAIDPESFSPTLNPAEIEAGPITAISWQAEVRIYYLSNTDNTFLDEVGLSGSWGNYGSISAARPTKKAKRRISFVG